MFEDLFKLIDFIESCYNNFTDEWSKSDKYVPINQKKFLVKNVFDESNDLSFIMNYRNFLNESVLDSMFFYISTQINSFLTYRIKTQNSILYKLTNYSKSEKHGFGESPINKCLNDIFGIRIILNGEAEFELLKQSIIDKYGSKYKCIDSSKNDYVATHIYFKRDNLNFQWELQIWDKKHEKSNYLSHKEYKQMYTDWEDTSR